MVRRPARRMDCGGGQACAPEGNPVRPPPQAPTAVSRMDPRALLGTETHHYLETEVAPQCVRALPPSCLERFMVINIIAQRIWKNHIRVHISEIRILPRIHICTVPIFRVKRKGISEVVKTGSGRTGTVQSLGTIVPSCERHDTSSYAPRSDWPQVRTHTTRRPAALAQESWRTGLQQTTL